MEPLRGFASYDPPYESPIEDTFALALAKYVELETAVEKQVDVQTICGTFRLDFLATAPNGFRIGYECDGKEFHSGPDWVRDEWRDAMILGAGAVDAIVRVPGPGIFYHLEDVMFLLSKWDRTVFSERARLNLERLASDDVLAVGGGDWPIWPGDFDGAWVAYSDRKVRNPVSCALWRRNRIPAGLREYWQSLFWFAVWVGGGNLDDVMARRQTLNEDERVLWFDLYRELEESGINGVSS
jgi:hypothetical protein